jgi:hypothetical protein
VAVDGLLEQQALLDVANLAMYLGRNFTNQERSEILGALLKAKRHCFIESGITHSNFQELFLSVTTPSQQTRVQDVMGLLLQKSPFH